MSDQTPCDECESEGRNCTAHGGRPGIPYHGSDQTPDLIARLRSKFPTVQEAMANSREAADEIERLRAEIEDMKNALWKACGDDEDAVAECLGGVS